MKNYWLVRVISINNLKRPDIILEGYFFSDTNDFAIITEEVEKKYPPDEYIITDAYHNSDHIYSL